MPSAFAQVDDRRAGSGATGHRAIARADIFNVVSIVGAAIAAHTAPCLTLLFAYAVLGPAHYLTEISWLHRRNYFVDGGLRVAIYLVGFALVFAVAGSSPLGCAALSGALALSITAALGVSTLLQVGVTIGAFALGLALSAAGVRAIVDAAILIPTIVHVLAFTIGFVVRGVRKSKTLGGYFVVASILAASASFLVLPTTPDAQSAPAKLAKDFFGAVLAQLGGSHWPLSAHGAAGILAFGYTYHYLNWFSKTEVVSWHRQNRRQLILIGVTCGAIWAAYIVDVRLGLLLSLPLSIAHVFLEFPLNAVTFGVSRRALQRERL